MLQITFKSTGKDFILKLDGGLAGPGVENLARFWRSLREAMLHRGTKVDLSELHRVDGNGKRLLEAMQSDGAELIGAIS
jgi:ABC-type transporter Mla MlaB component